MPEIKNLHPVLPVEPTIVASDLSQLPVVNLPNYGDPFGVPGPPSSGPGTGGGIGSGAGRVSVQEKAAASEAGFTEWEEASVPRL